MRARRAVLIGRRARHFERHRPDRVAVGRQPEGVGDKEAVLGLELHDRASEHAAQAPEEIVAEIGWRPLDHVRPEHARLGHRPRRMPPGAERVRVKEGPEHKVGGRRDDDADVEAGFECGGHCGKSENHSTGGTLSSLWPNSRWRT